ncbi:MAG: MFS transporter [Nanoarchaeota archaeon]|nr:MFS transporter [Nanoarchaeota archaeon]
MVKKYSENFLKKSARRNSISEGIFASIKTHLGDNFVQPFAIALNASSSVVALLTSVAGLLWPFSQIYGSKLMQKQSRKKITLSMSILRSFFWLSLIVLAILSYKNKISWLLPALLLIFYGIYNLVAGIAYPSWFSWMGDIIDENHRGRWFSKRDLIIGFSGAAALIFASLFLDFFKNKGFVLIGFSILFFLAFVFRILSCYFLNKQYEPKLKIKDTNYFSFAQFLKRAPKTNFGKFTLFRAMMAFATTISTALLAVYLLRYLEFNYLTYMIIVFGASVFSFFALELWGKFADKYGNYKILIITTFFIPIISLLWILHPSPIYLFFVPSLLNHVVAVGFNLATNNFIYDNVSKQKRGGAISYYNILQGIGVFFGSVLAAFLIKYLNTKIISPIILIFLISTFVRMFVIAYWVPKLREVRKTQKFKGVQSFEKLIKKDFKPTIIQEIHQITSIGKYLHLK